MNDHAAICDPKRIDLFLSQQLSKAEQTDFETHLDHCTDCRRRLEAAAAGDDVWSEVRESLRGDCDQAGHLQPGGSLIQTAENENHTGEPDAILSLLQPTDDDRMIGRLGTYEVTGVIGSGGMGVVLKAFDPALTRFVAIKLLAPHLGNNGTARKRFSREAQAAAAVVHDNVIEIYGVSDLNGLPFLVMPYVRGPSLQRRLDDEGPFTPVEILRIGMQAAAGLAAAHTQGLVHRDVKPANILLGDGVERLKLTDFGLARAADDARLTRTGIIAGTPQYMSPEQARGDSIDSRSDLFSLGSVLYAMATGREPFRAETSYGVLRKITDETPQPIREINPDIPDWLCAIISRLMEKRPDDRFQTAREVAQLLEECLAHAQQPTVVPLPARDRLQTSPAKPPHRRWRSIAWLVAFALAAVLAGIFIVIELNKGTLTIESSAGSVPIRITRGDQVVKELTVTQAGKQVRIAAGTYRVEIDGPADRITVENDTVELRRGETEVVRVVLKRSSSVEEPHTTQPETPSKPARDTVDPSSTNVAAQLKYDERSTIAVVTRFDARIEKLHVAHTGVDVEQGDPLVELYSDQLLAAETELLRSRQHETSRPKGVSFVELARQKLGQLGLTNEQVAELEKRGTPTGRLTLRAPVSGVVTKQQATVGAFVKQGTWLFTIADPSRLCVELYVPTHAIGKIQHGQTISLMTEQNQMIAGRVSFIAPTVDPRTNAVQVRIDVANMPHKVRPGEKVKFLEKQFGITNENADAPHSTPLVSAAKNPTIPDAIALMTEIKKLEQAVQQLESRQEQEPGEEVAVRLEDARRQLQAHRAAHAASIRLLELELKDAESALGAYTQDLTRIKQLAEQEIISTKEVRDGERKVAAAQLRLDRARALLEFWNKLAAEK